VITWRPAALFAVLCGLTLWWAPVPWLVLAGIAAFVAMVTLVDALTAASPRDVQLSRSGATRVRLGESATVTLTIHNGSVRPLRALVRDAWVPSAGAAPPYAHRLEIPPESETTVETHLTPTRRGERPSARTTIRSYGPLQLGYRQSSRRLGDRITPEWTLRVLPAFPSRRLLPEKLSRLRIIDGQVVTRGRGQGSEFDSLRDYVHGDDPRSIDWWASARREHVVVRQWRPERDRRVLCVLDTGRTSAMRIGTAAAPLAAAESGLPRLDVAIDAALLLSTLAAHAGDRVDLLAIDTHTQASVSASSRRSLPRMLEALAPLQPALVETDFGRVVAEVLTIERKRALVVIFTTLDPAALGEGLLPVLPSLVSRHTVIVAAAHDPGLDALAAERGSTAALHTAAAAELGLAELRRVRSALSRHGVHVIDEPADTFAGAVADTYLSLKATGRL
jgi:uncharacterized protein (DUF58 family)